MLVCSEVSWDAFVLVHSGVIYRPQKLALEDRFGADDWLIWRRACSGVCGGRGVRYQHSRLMNSLAATMSSDQSSSRTSRTVKDGLPEMVDHFGV